MYRRGAEWKHERHEERRGRHHRLYQHGSGIRHPSGCNTYRRGSRVRELVRIPNT